MANVGGFDRILRILVGAGVLAATFFGPFTEILYPWGMIAIVPLFTGLFKWCPAYTLFGIKTCKTCSTDS